MEDYVCVSLIVIGAIVTFVYLLDFIIGTIVFMFKYSRIYYLSLTIMLMVFAMVVLMLL